MAGDVGQPVQHRKGRIREGNPMFPPALYPGGGDDPQSAGPINFHPLRLETSLVRVAVRIKNCRARAETLRVPDNSPRRGCPVRC